MRKAHRNLEIKYKNEVGHTIIKRFSDVLIGKKVEGNRPNTYELLYLSIYVTPGEKNEIMKKSNQIEIRDANGKRGGLLFKIDDIKNYQIVEETKGKNFLRLLLKRKANLFIDDEVQTPYFILSEKNKDNFPKILIEEVRKSLIAPLFPNFYSPYVVAKEVSSPDKSVDLKQAQEMIDKAMEGNVTTIEEKIVQDGVKKYNEWAEYLLEKMRENNLIRTLHVATFPENVYAYELIIKEEQIREIISEGVKNNHLKISNRHIHENHYTTFDKYMIPYSKVFKDIIDSVIGSKIIHKTGDIRPLTSDIQNNLNRKPIGAQKDVIEAVVKSLQKQKRAMIVGEPGVGKTFMTIASAFIDAKYTQKPMKTLVLSPDHLVKSAWETEVKEALESFGVQYHHIRSASDLIKYEKLGYISDDTHRVFIIGQNVAKNGFAEFPVALWVMDPKFKQKVFKCPSCMQVQKKRIKNSKDKIDAGEDEFIDKPLAYDFYTKKRFNNKHCKECGESMWQPLNNKGIDFSTYVGGKSRKKTFMYSPPMGFIPDDKEMVDRWLRETTNKYNDTRMKKYKDKIKHLREAQMILDGTKKEKKRVSPYKVPVSTYVKKKLKNKFTHLITDEVHEYQNVGTSRSDALCELIASVPKIISATGTMMNGYAKSIFLNIFMMFPEIMKNAGYEFKDVQKFQVDFGVTEKRFRLEDDGTRKVIAPKSKPGISPVIFPLFLMDSSVFINLEDLENSLPPLEHEIVAVKMSDELKAGKKELEKAVADHIGKNDSKFKSMMPLLYSYLDMPTVPKELKDEAGNTVYTTKSVSQSQDVKMEALRKIVLDEKSQGNRSIVYSYYTGDPINNYLKDKLEAVGLKVTVLNKEGEKSISCSGQTVAVKKADRHIFIQDEVALGTDVLIVSPELIKTGTNLIDFNAIVYYQMTYKVYTIRQASGRIRRIGQTKDCKIYFLYYAESFQEDIASLMATKIVASEAIEGNMDSSGLEAITNERTPEEELANKFYQHMGLDKKDKSATLI